MCSRWGLAERCVSSPDAFGVDGAHEEDDEWLDTLARREPIDDAVNLRQPAAIS